MKHMKLEYVKGKTKMPTPFIGIPVKLLTTDLSPTALLVYGLLLSHAMIYGSQNNVSGNETIVFRYPLSKLANDLGKSPSTAKRAVGELVDVGLIKRDRNVNGLPPRMMIRIPKGQYTQPGALSTRGKSYSPGGQIRSGTGSGMLPRGVQI